MHDHQGFSWRSVVAGVRGRLRLGVPEVPAELDACEGDCREIDCSRERWTTCEKRQRRMAERRAQERR